jgi:hypothetical protein
MSQSRSFSRVFGEFGAGGLWLEQRKSLKRCELDEKGIHCAVLREVFAYQDCSVN